MFIIFKKNTLLALVATTINLAIVNARNPKKGVAFSGAQACSALEPHTDSSWWYSWSTHSGFDERWSFCDTSSPQLTQHPADAARAAGMEFVPMFWSSVPDPANLDAQTIADLQRATHVMGFNEPERADQANLSPALAAAKWADVMAIANNFNLKIVGPCMTKDAFAWYDSWLNECKTLYPGTGCRHDAVCIHMYMQPHPCNTTRSWECFGDETGYHAKYHLNRWWNNYGNKPIWVTEYGCYPWITGGCNSTRHAAIMDQLTSLFESVDYQNKVARYNWFTTYSSDPTGFGSGALNVPNWEHVGDGVGCTNRTWVANAKPKYSWGIETIHQCEALARANPSCYVPLGLSFDNDNCYCATNACSTVVNTWGGMKTFRELALLAHGDSSLSASGLQYNSFAAAPTTTGPTKAPSPTKMPTSQPTFGTVKKYICQKSDPGDAQICLNGAVSLGSICAAAAQDGQTGCGGPKLCWLADCPDSSGPNPPSTNAPVTPPPSSVSGPNPPATNSPVTPPPSSRVCSATDCGFCTSRGACRAYSTCNWSQGVCSKV